MTSELASRVQRFVDGGAAPITVDEISNRRPAGRPSNKRYAVLAAVLVLSAVLLVALVISRDDDPSGRAPTDVASSTLSLTQIPDGVSVQQFGRRLTFVVRVGNDITVFDTNVQHLSGENGLWWCPNEQLFVAPTHAETFSSAGKAIGGPAAASLDRFRTTVRHGELSIDPARLIPGAAGNAQTAVGTGETGVVGWDSGPGSFCTGALKANNAATPTNVLDVNALATGAYDKAIYDVPTGLIEIRLSGTYGSTFTFDDPRYQYCLLAPEPGARHSCRVELSPGDYLVDDTVSGHQQAGYEATIHVTALPELPQESPRTTTSTTGSHSERVDASAAVSR